MDLIIENSYINGYKIVWLECASFLVCRTLSSHLIVF